MFARLLLVPAMPVRDLIFYYVFDFMLTQYNYVSITLVFLPPCDPSFAYKFRGHRNVSGALILLATSPVCQLMLTSRGICHGIVSLTAPRRTFGSRNDVLELI